MFLNNEDRTRNKLYWQINSDNQVSSWRFWRKKRYIISILGFFGFLNVFTLHSILSIAIVDMTQLKNVTLENGTIVQEREFEWDSRLQGYVLSSFFYGYIFTQILGGYLATKIGGAKVFGAGIASTAIFTIITPSIANINVYLLMALRTAEGLLEGVTYPASINIWAHWAPPLEKTRLATIAISGTYIGAVVAMPVCSLLTTVWGWESVFYVFGCIALVWYAIWIWVVKDSPYNDTKLNPDELKYITESINAVELNEVSEIPWCLLAKSKLIWALSLILTCEAWGIHTMITFMPQMMKSALKFDINKSGFITALPYVAMFISTQVGGQLSDWILRKKYMSLSTVRKLLIFIGFMLQASFLLATAIWTLPLTTPIFLVVGATFGGIAVSGIIANSLDITPRFASIIFGINNTFATIPGIVSPILTGYVVKDLTDVNQWKTVFYIASGIYLIGAITSTIFISGEVQPWATVKQVESTNQTETEMDLKYNTENKLEKE